MINIVNRHIGCAANWGWGGCSRAAAITGPNDANDNATGSACIGLGRGLQGHKHAQRQNDRDYPACYGNMEVDVVVRIHD